MRNSCVNCENFKDVFGNFVQCVATGRLIDYEYWNNIQPKDCPKKADEADGVDEVSK